MNSASMATNLLGRPIRLKDKPPGCDTRDGSIAVVTIDDRGVHYVLLVGGRLIPVENGEAFTVLD